MSHFEVGDAVSIIENPAAAAATREVPQSRVDMAKMAGVCISLLILSSSHQNRF